MICILYFNFEYITLTFNTLIINSYEKFKNACNMAP